MSVKDTLELMIAFGMLVIALLSANNDSKK
ncbi:putative holin-like toxin [Lapidilactobacillus wuchangensis]|nr:putative holin-like toxin [Lapidilactobacillus wuchangensis]